MKTAINLLPPTLRRQQMVSRRAVQWSAVVCVVLATIWSAGWFKLGEYHSLSQKLEILNREHRPGHAMLEELVSMRNTMSGLQREEAVATELEQQRHILTVLGLISQSAQQSDQKLRVTGLRVMDFQGAGSTASDSGVVILSGQSLDNPSVAELLDRLQHSGLFTNVELVSLNERRMDSVPYQDYEVRCEL